MGISHPAKNANKLGQVWQNIVVKSDIHGQKENGVELFRSRRHFEEIKPLSPIIKWPTSIFS